MRTRRGLTGSVARCPRTTARHRAAVEALPVAAGGPHGPGRDRAAPPEAAAVAVRAPVVASAAEAKREVAPAAAELARAARGLGPPAQVDLAVRDDRVPHRHAGPLAAHEALVRLGRGSAPMSVDDRAAADLEVRHRAVAALRRQDEKTEGWARGGGEASAARGRLA
jgi:hypothetical protein